MKKAIILVFAVYLVSCNESDSLKSTIKNEGIEVRTVTDRVYFYDGLETDLVLNAADNSYEIELDNDFEFRPYGVVNWISYAGGKKFKVSCRCVTGAESGKCNPSISFSEPPSVGCSNPCEGTCSIDSRISNSDDSVVATFPHGGELRLD